MIVQMGKFLVAHLCSLPKIPSWVWPFKIRQVGDQVKWLDLFHSFHFLDQTLLAKVQLFYDNQSRKTLKKGRLLICKQDDNLPK